MAPHIRLLTFSAIWLVPAMSYGATITADYDGVYGRVVRFFLVDAFPNGASVPAGRFSWINVTGLPGTTSFAAFCIELRQHASQHSVWECEDLENAPVPHNLSGSPMGEDKANSLCELWGEYRDDVIDKDSAAAFQLAPKQARIFGARCESAAGGGGSVEVLATDGGRVRAAEL